MIFHEIGLHAPDFDENLYDHIYVTRRITACYSRGRNRAAGQENDGFSKNTLRKLRFLPRGERDMVQPSSNIKIILKYEMNAHISAS